MEPLQYSGDPRQEPHPCCPPYEPAQAKVTVSGGCPWASSTKMSPCCAGTALPKEPESTMSPGSSLVPNEASLLASQATASAGCPREAAPSPSATREPLWLISIPTVRRSTSRKLRLQGPVVNPP